jgi:hypothetical protein
VSGGHRHLGDLALITAAAMTVAALFILSYRADRPCIGAAASCYRIDPLSGNLKQRWRVSEDLSATQVKFNRIGADAADLEIHGADSSRSETDSGVSYTSGLFSPGWYEFTTELRTNGRVAKGGGARVELSSDRWRFVSRGQRFGQGDWRRIAIYFRPADYNPMVEISCRFVGVSPHSTASALLRNMRLVKIAGMPPRGKPRFNMEKKEEARFRTRRGRSRGSGGFGGVALIAVLLGSSAGVCWRLLG